MGWLSGGQPRAVLALALAVSFLVVAPLSAGFTHQSATRVATHAYARVLDADGAFVLVSEWTGVINDPEGAYPTTCTIVLLEPLTASRLALATHSGQSCKGLTGAVDHPRVAYPATTGLRVFDAGTGGDAAIGHQLTAPVLEGGRVAAFNATGGTVEVYTTAGIPVASFPGRPLAMEGDLVAHVRPPTGTFTSLVLRNATTGWERIVPDNNGPMSADFSGGDLAYATTGDIFTKGGPLRIVNATGPTRLIGHPDMTYGRLHFDGAHILTTRITSREVVLVRENGTARSLGAGEAVGFAGAASIWVDRDTGPGLALDHVFLGGEWNPPTSSVVASAPAVANGWRKGPLYLTFTTADDGGGSGILGTRTWVRDGPRGELLPSLGEGYSLFENGYHHLTFWAVDNNGNEQAPYNETFRLDSTPPTVRLDAQPYWAAGRNNWFHDAVTLVVVPADQQSGVGTYGVRANGGPYLSGVFLNNEGLYAVDAFTEDKVGHRVATSGVYGVDRTPPETRLTVNSGTRHASGWYTTPVTFGYEVSDPLSGHFTTYAGIDGGPFWIVGYPGTTTFATEGPHSLRYHARDNAGNNEAPQSTAFKIDLNPPTATILSPEGGQIWMGGAEITNTGRGPVIASGPLFASATASDSASGVDRIVFRVDGVERAVGPTWWWNTATETPGSHILEVLAYDVVGRASVVRSVSVFVLPGL